MRAQPGRGGAGGILLSPEGWYAKVKTGVQVLHTRWSTKRERGPVIMKPPTLDGQASDWMVCRHSRCRRGTAAPVGQQTALRLIERQPSERSLSRKRLFID